MKRFSLTQLLLFMTWCGIGCFVISQYLATMPYRGRINGVQNGTFYHYAEQKQFGSTIDSDAVRRSTAWLPSEADPPLSARSALAAADKLRRERLRDVNGWEWGLESITLLPLDGANHKWCWKVNFEANPTAGFISGRYPQFSAFVLMNGEVITPEEKDYDNGFGIVPAPAVKSGTKDSPPSH
jgi:hypothetical protein